MAKLIYRGKKWYSDLRMPVWDQEKKKYVTKRVRQALHTNQEVALLKLGKLIRKRQAVRGGQDFADSSWESFKDRVQELVASSPKPTRMAYNRALANIETISPSDVRDMTPGALEQMQAAWVNRGRGKYIIVKDVKTIKALMRKAEAWGLVKRQDWRAVKTKKLPRGRVDYHSLDELQRMIKKMKGMWLTAVYLGSRLGLRPAEAYWLEKTDVDFERNEVRIGPKPHWTPKDHQAREIPMERDIRAYLDRLLRVLPGKYVVADPKGQRPTYESYLTLARRAFKDAKFASNLYKLRHTFGAQLRQAGAQLDEIRDLMGHESVKTTEIYAHLGPHSGRQAINRLPSLKTTSLAPVEPKPEPSSS